MTKLKHIGEFIVNPANIAYMEIWVGKDGMSKGTTIYFNAYAAAANETASAFEMPCVQILGLAPTQIMDSINNEPVF